MPLRDIRPALYSFLISNGAVSALVGTRVYPVILPQGQTQPSIVYNEISGSGHPVMTGATGLASPRMQIAAWATTADKAHTVALAVKNCLDGYSGPMGEGAALVPVQGVFFDMWRDIYDDVPKLYGKLADYFLWHEEK